MCLKRLEDVELVHRFSNGEHKCFEELMRRYQSRIYYHIYSMVKNQDEAEDLFQEVCIKVIKSLRLENYAEEGKFYPWFKRIAHNLTIDYLRKKQKLRTQSHITAHDEDMDIFDVIRSEEANALEGMIEEQIVNDIRQLIELLPAEQKEIIELRHYKQWSFKEIADEKNISINTALGRMRYALINLRRLMQEKSIDLALM